MTAVDTTGRVAVPGAAAEGAARETAIVGRNLTKPERLDEVMPDPHRRAIEAGPDT